jgi:peptidoglycan-associated lipoprotein
MKRKSIVLGLVVLSTLFWGCPKKAPKTPADDLTKTTSTAPTPEEVTAAPAPPSSADRTPDPLSGDLAQVNAYASAQGLIGDVFFDFDQSDLRADARERLAKNAQWLSAHPEFVVTLEGHCDERGTNEYNLALGERRAKATMNYLVAQGVQASRITIISYGKERPTCTEHSEACWAQNRRAHFLVKAR